ncbi:MAG: hypothetical protein M0Q49_04680 [Porticoccaceae bacterium]|nr:hypothetical protein [Porticoccaceae bacterium]
MAASLIAVAEGGSLCARQEHDLTERAFRGARDSDTDRLTCVEILDFSAGRELDDGTGRSGGGSHDLYRARAVGEINGDRRALGCVLSGDTEDQRRRFTRRCRDNRTLVECDKRVVRKVAGGSKSFHAQVVG